MVEWELSQSERSHSYRGNILHTGGSGLGVSIGRGGQANHSLIVNTVKNEKLFVFFPFYSQVVSVKVIGHEAGRQRLCLPVFGLV